jgi:hypothetical protein
VQPNTQAANRRKSHCNKRFLVGLAISCVIGGPCLSRMMMASQCVRGDAYAATWGRNGKMYTKQKYSFVDMLLWTRIEIFIFILVAAVPTALSVFAGWTWLHAKTPLQTCNKITLSC